jgi:Flp pilus assembly protein TadG
VRRRGQRGATLIEFAIVLPLFLTLVLGLLDYGYFFYVGVTAAGAAREGARQCTLVSLGACGDCNPSASVDYMEKVGMGDYTSASSSCATSAGTIMYSVDVSVDYPALTSYMTSLGLLPGSGTDGHALATAGAVMRGQ